MAKKKVSKLAISDAEMALANLTLLLAGEKDPDKRKRIHRGIKKCKDFLNAVEPE